MYKDKDKQREADRERQRRYRRDKQGVTQGVTEMIKDVAANGGEYSFTTVKGEVQDVHHTKPKRGKDIKCFEDLPPDVQQTIEQMSDDKTEHKRRTAIAIAYQHTFGEDIQYL